MYGSSGSYPKVRINAAATSGSTRLASAVRFRPQGVHPSPRFRTLAHFGDDSAPHTMHRTRQGVLEPGYGVSGSSPRERIASATASGSSGLPMVNSVPHEADLLLTDWCRGGLISLNNNQRNVRFKTVLRALMLIALVFLHIKLRECLLFIVVRWVHLAGPLSGVNL